MKKEVYIYHCSENASEVLLMNLEASFSGNVKYINESEIGAPDLLKHKTLAILTDQFLKNKKCLDPLLTAFLQLKENNFFSIIYYHKSINRSDKHYEVKSNGRIDLYYYRNFWERRYSQERKWIIDSGNLKIPQRLSYLAELKQIKEHLSEIIHHLSALPMINLEEMLNHPSELLDNWYRGKGTREDDIFNHLTSNEIITRVPGLDLPKDENNEFTDNNVDQDEKFFGSELLKKLVHFKKSQLGDAEIAEDFIEEELARKQRELAHESNNHSFSDQGYTSSIDFENDSNSKKLEAATPNSSEGFEEKSDLENTRIIIDDEWDEGEIHEGKSIKLDDELQALLTGKQKLSSFNEKEDQDDQVEMKGNDMRVEYFYGKACEAYEQNMLEKAQKHYEKAKELAPWIKTSENEAIFYQKKPKDISALKKSLKNDLNQTVDGSLSIMITGASAGIGRATAIKLASMGHDLILTGRRKKRLKKLKKAITKEFGIKIHILSFDIRNREQGQKKIKEYLSEGKKIDVLINNAGLASGLSSIEEGDYDDWDRMIDTNVKGLLNVSRCIIPHMVERKVGHIINMGSIAGKEVYPKGNVYNASKFAVGALTKAMRLDLVGKNIRVSEIAPGHVEETEFAIVRFHGDEAKAQIYDDFNPLTSKDIADIIAFALHQPPHVNIQEILVMGTQQASASTIDRSGRKFD